MSLSEVGILLVEACGKMVADATQAQPGQVLPINLSFLVQSMHQNEDEIISIMAGVVEANTNPKRTVRRADKVLFAGWSGSYAMYLAVCDKQNPEVAGIRTLAPDVELFTLGPYKDALRLREDSASATQIQIAREREEQLALSGENAAQGKLMAAKFLAKVHVELVLRIPWKDKPYAVREAASELLLRSPDSLETIATVCYMLDLRLEDVISLR